MSIPPPLLPSSSHPPHITSNIPYSLAYRLVRICSEPDSLSKRFSELRELLLSRNYSPSVIDDAISRASRVKRTDALKRVTKQTSDRVVFALDYHPALPSISSIVKRHWSVMVKDQHLKEVFPSPPLVSYRKPPNNSLRDLLVKSKIPQNRNNRVKTGNKKCNKPACNTCPFFTEDTTVKSSKNNFSVPVKKLVNCETKNVIYVITCSKQKCKFVQYIGETSRRLKDRFSQHLNYVKKADFSQPTGYHFNLAGHSISDMKVCIIEQCMYDSVIYRQTRESHFIDKFNTKYSGLNRKH